MAADTLAYLTEVDSDLQKTAAISNQLVSALVELLNSCTVAARQAAFRYCPQIHVVAPRVLSRFYIVGLLRL